MELSNEEIVDLIHNNGEDVNKKEMYAQLYRQNYPVICKICRNFSRGNEQDYEDFLSESFFGLVTAVERYDSSQGCKFMSYAETVIRSTLSRYAYSNGHTVRLPEYLFTMMRKYHRAYDQVYMEYGRKPTDTELMEILGISKARLDGLKKSIDQTAAVSLDTAIGEDLTLIDTVEDPEDAIGAVNDHFDFEIFKADIWDAVDGLDGKKPQILRKRFQEGKTYGQIGEELEITAERVRQLQNKALSRLSRSSKLKIYRDDYILSHAYHGSGAKSFQHTGTSSTERVALDLYSHNINEKMRTAEAKVREISRVKHTSLGEAFTMYLQEKYADLLEEVNA